MSARILIVDDEPAVRRNFGALLEDAGVAALSGTAFGDFGEGYLRFSVANSIENIEKALDRVGTWVEKNL